MQIMQNSVDFTESCVEMYQTSQRIAVFRYKTCKKNSEIHKCTSMHIRKTIWKFSEITRCTSLKSNGGGLMQEYQVHNIKCACKKKFQKFIRAIVCT